MAVRPAGLGTRCTTPLTHTYIMRHDPKPFPSPISRLPLRNCMCVGARRTGLHRRRGDLALVYFGALLLAVEFSLGPVNCAAAYRTEKTSMAMGIRRRDLLCRRVAPIARARLRRGAIAGNYGPIPFLISCASH